MDAGSNGTDAGWHKGQAIAASGQRAKNNSEYWAAWSLLQTKSHLRCESFAKFLQATVSQLR